MPMGEDQIVTAPTSAARLLTEDHPGRHCLVVNDPDLTEDVIGVETNTPAISRARRPAQDGRETEMKVVGLDEIVPQGIGLRTPRPIGRLRAAL